MPHCVPVTTLYFSCTVLDWHNPSCPYSQTASAGLVPMSPTAHDRSCASLNPHALSPKSNRTATTSPCTDFYILAGVYHIPPKPFNAAPSHPSTSHSPTPRTKRFCESTAAPHHSVSRPHFALKCYYYIPSASPVMLPNQSQSTKSGRVRDDPQLHHKVCVARDDAKLHYDVWSVRDGVNVLYYR